MRHGEGGDHRDERAEAPERNDQTKQKQQMICPFEDVEKSQVDEPQRRLMPPRVEPDQTGIAEKLEGANDAAGRQKPNHRRGLQPEFLENGIDRKIRQVRLNGVLVQHVEQRLVRYQRRLIREPRIRCHVREGRPICLKRFVRRQRDPNRGNSRTAQAAIAFVQLGVVVHPSARHRGQPHVQSREIQVAGSALRDLEVGHGREGDAKKHVELWPLRLDESLDDDVGRDVVGAEAAGEGPKKRRHQQNRAETPETPPI